MTFAKIPGEFSTERSRRHGNTVPTSLVVRLKAAASEAWLASTARQRGEPVASLSAPFAATSRIDLKTEIAAVR